MGNTMALAPLIIFPIIVTIFLICFVGFWLLISSRLLDKMGWSSLVAAFPDKGEPPIRTLHGQSGKLGSVYLNGILNLAVCPDGMRVSIAKMFGPFAASFLVPWGAIQVERRQGTFANGFRKMAAIQLGQPALGTLTIADFVADELAFAAGMNWPERGSFRDDYWPRAAMAVLYNWLVTVVLLGGFLSMNIVLHGGPLQMVIAVLALAAVAYGVPIWGLFLWRLARR